MNKKNHGMTMLILSFVAGCSSQLTSKNQELLGTSITNLSDVKALFPTSPAEIENRTQALMKHARTIIDAIIAVPASKRTFDNTARALDQAIYTFVTESSALSFLEHVSPDQALRQAAHASALKLQEFSIDTFVNNRDLYLAFKEYVEGNMLNEQLNDAQQYYISETMKELKKNGLDLPDVQLTQVKELNKQIGELSLKFAQNIAEGQRSIEVTKDELSGVDEDFVAQLPQTKDGKYIVGTDRPTYDKIMQQCSNGATRKKMYLAYEQRAYPENMPVLDALIAKRDELARRLGFASYAHLDLSNQMVGTPERAEQFVNDIIQKAQVKDDQEFELFKKDLPQGVTLSEDGKMYPWDRSYLISEYKKKHFNIDELKIAEYFPMEKTVKELMNIYEQFLNITLKEVPGKGFWHEDVKVIEVYDTKGTRLRGYLLLDLHPRPNKYNHAASFTILPTLKRADGTVTPAVDVVVTNFPKSTATKPSLLQHGDVETFFHEFGHAIHTILGSTELASQSGTQVKLDFVELPSQMLEEWMWDAQMLKQASGHYKTGEPLPDDIIAKKIELKRLQSGYWVLRQLNFALLSLAYFKPGAQKDTHAISRELYKRVVPHMEYIPESYHQASFGHLTEYAARYYGYMWSKVFALDLFDYIKQYGLLNPVVGQRYIDEILGKGGSQDPNILLKNFLGREPNQEAFLKDLGL